MAMINHRALPPRLETRRLALRHTPLPRQEYLEVLADAGAVGRQLRAVMTLSETAIEEMAITTVSDFTLAYAWTISSQLGHNHFAAFAETKDCKMVDPRFPINDEKVAFSTFARNRLPGIKEISSRYFLSSINPADVVIAPWACTCCFETQYLDYVKSALDLQGLGTMLIIRITALNFDQAAKQLIDSPFLSWMKTAGFQPTWFLGFDDIIYLNELSPDMAANERASFLSPLPDNNVRVAADSLIERLKESNNRNNNPFFPFLFNLYLVLQRVKWANRADLNRVFTEALQWERQHAADRRLRRAGNTSLLLDRFAELAPELLAQS